MSPTQPRKRLIISCDGTWQAGDKIPTTSLSNAAKLSRMLHPDSGGAHPIPQVVYYQSGVGTTSNGGILDYLPNPLSGGFGVGLEDNVLTAYHYLSTNYHHGDDRYLADEIFLFGFSRGAFTARALAGLVTELGLMKPEFLDEFRRAYRLYRDVGNLAAARGLDNVKFFEKVKGLSKSLKREDYEFLMELHEGPKVVVDGVRGRRKMYDDVRIKVVGVWDTVGALGIPDSSWVGRLLPQVNSKFKFHDAALNSKIENAFQALALDEHRGAFTPTLWYLDNKFLEEGQVPNLKQCWFPGWHESIGGGDTAANHWTQYFVPDLSEMHDVTLAWMCDQVDGLLRFDRKASDAILLREDADRVNWASAMETDATWLLWFFHFSTFGGDLPRTPGRYHLQNKQWNSRTNETMHPSVQYRIENSQHRLFRYFPAVLNEHAGWLPNYREPHAPKWQWKESMSVEDGQPDGNGAVWVRPAVPRLWPYRAEDQITIDEWVIREVDGRMNFEAALLPPMFKKRLARRNERLINEAAAHSHENDQDVVSRQYWTRTAWVGEPRTQKPSKGYTKHVVEWEHVLREKALNEVHAGAREAASGKHQHSGLSVKAKKGMKNGGVNGTVEEDHMNGGAVQAA